MIVFLMVAGGLLCTAGIGVGVYFGARWALNEQRADAWDNGYNTRGYDTVSGSTSPNPYVTGQYPVVDPSTSTEPCHVPGCVKHVDGMHVTAENAAISHNPFHCDYCIDHTKAEDITTDAMTDILIRTAAALKGDPHPLTMHDWSDLPDVATALGTAPKCESRKNNNRCVLMYPHAGQHRDTKGRSWPNMAGFTSGKEATG